MNWLVVVAIQPWSYVPTFYFQLSEASHDRVGCRRWQNQSLPPFKTKVKIDRRSKLESVNINHVHHILICFFALFCYQYAFQICFSLFLLIHFIILAVTENGSIGDKWVLKKKKKKQRFLLWTDWLTKWWLILILEKKIVLSDCGLEISFLSTSFLNLLNLFSMLPLSCMSVNARLNVGITGKKKKTTFPRKIVFTAWPWIAIW